MHGLPTLQYLNDQQHGEGSDVAKAIIDGTFDEKEYQAKLAAKKVVSEVFAPADAAK